MPSAFDFTKSEFLLRNLVRGRGLLQSYRALRTATRRLSRRTRCDRPHSLSQNLPSRSRYPRPSARRGRPSWNHSATIHVTRPEDTDLHTILHLLVDHRSHDDV